MEEAGCKLAVSGGGRGNISHQCTADECSRAFGANGRFTRAAFHVFTPEDWRRLLLELNVPTCVDESDRIYPASQSAQQVRDALVQACKQSGVQFIFHHQTATLIPPDTPDGLWRVDEFQARNILLAAGGRSASALGSNGSGFVLAQALGHTLVEPVPALTPLYTKEEWPWTLSGISLPEAVLTLESGQRHPPRRRGSVLFTHHGLSGPAALDISGAVSRHLLLQPEAQLRLAMPESPPDIQDLRRRNGPQTVYSWLGNLLPRAVAQTLLEQSNIPADAVFARLTAAQQKQLASLLEGIPLTIIRTGGFAHSMLTDGGVSVKDVRPGTLESRLHPRLYFAGEILDIQGPTGGYNIHWAAASGHLAGISAAAN